MSTRDQYPFTTFPQQNFAVKDETDSTVFVEELLGLHRPHVAMRARKGLLNVPTYYQNYAAAAAALGAETFDPVNSTYFSRDAFFANTVFGNNGSCWITRLADSPATAALVVELAVQERADIPVYTVDEDGLRTVDADSDYIPTGEVRDGLRLFWHTRSLAEGETAANITSRTVVITETDGSSGSTDYSTVFYPMFIVTANSPGLWGNKAAFSFYWNALVNRTSITDNIISTLYTMSPVEKEYATDTVDPVYSKLGERSLSFSVKASAIDADTTRNWALSSVIADYYADEYALPFTITPILANFVTVGNLVIAAETARIQAEVSATGTFAIDDAYLVNLVTGRFASGVFYESIEIITETPDGYEETVANMASGVYHYLVDGADGDIDDITIDGLVKNFYELDLNADIVDVVRYPFNCAYDTGFSLDTKKAMIAFTGLRRAFIANVATQSFITTGETPAVTTILNTMATDLAMGETLATYADLFPDSDEFGTGVCRVNIFGQSAIPYNANQIPMPMTLWYCEAMSRLNSGQALTTEVAGLPNAEVTVFDPATFNWTPSSSAQRDTLWDARINYAQFCDRTRLFVAAVRSAYASDRSSLSRAAYVFTEVVLEQALYMSWATYADVVGEWDTIRAAVVADAQERIDPVLNGVYTYELSMYRTADEETRGDVGHLQVILYAGFAQRIQTVTIICRRATTTA